GAYGVQVVTQVEDFVGTCRSLCRYPGGGKIVLHHAYPAVVCAGNVFGLALVDVRKGNFLEFFVFRIQGRTGKGTVEGGGFLWVGVVAHELVIDRRLYG